MKRMSVTLIDKAVFALAELRNLNGLSNADNINRALQLYAVWEKQVQDGSEFLIRHADGSTEKITLL